MNKVEKHSIRKEEQGTLLEPCRLKDIEKGCNGQEVHVSTPVETRCTRNDVDQLRQHSGWKWKVKNINLTR